MGRQLQGSQHRDAGDDEIDGEISILAPERVESSPRGDTRGRPKVTRIVTPNSLHPAVDAPRYIAAQHTIGVGCTLMKTNQTDSSLFLSSGVLRGAPGIFNHVSFSTQGAEEVQRFFHVCQRFFTAFGVRPGSSAAISANRFPSRPWVV